MQSKIIPTDSTTATIRYVMSPKVGKAQRVEERVAQVYAQHSGISTAAADFLDLRQEHGQQGRMRKSKGRYYEPDDAAEATHLKVGKNWRPARPGETATHVRVAPENKYELCHQGYHMEYSFAPHEVNPDDPQQTAEAFRFVQESLTEMYPGEQMLMVGQTDAEGSEAARERGEGGKYHVHVVINSVIAKDMVVEGERYRAGQRLRGTLTDTDELRRRMDERLNERHAEYGLPAQTLAPVGSEQYERGKSDPATYWARLKGKLTDKEKVREGADLAIEHMSVTYAGSLAGLDRNDRMRTFSDTLEAVTDGDVTTSLRETKAGDVKLRSFKVVGRSNPFAKRSLGPRFGDDGVQDQLEQVAQGTWERVAAHQDLTHLPPREVGQLPGVERKQLLKDLEALAVNHGRTPVAKAPAVKPLEREAPAVSARDRASAALDDLWAEQQALDTPESRAALDRDIRGGGPDPLATQGAENKDDDLEVAPRRRRRSRTDEDRDRDETAPTVTEPVQSPQTDQEPLAAPPATHEAAEPSEARQDPRAYTRPREPEQPKKPEPFEHKKIDGLYGIDKKGLELIARQSAKQPSMVDFQLRAGTDAAYGQHGLSLHQATSPSGKKHGFIQISRQKVAELEQAAGDNYVDVKGDRVSGVVADVTYNEKRGLWLPSRFGKSELEPVTQDTMRQQVEAQREAREQGLVSLSRRAKLDEQARRSTIEIPRDHDRGYGLGG
ncbi:MAG: hypothetical protein ACTIL6_05945 [Brevibacterium aurantiacum]